MRKRWLRRNQARMLIGSGAGLLAITLLVIFWPFGSQDADESPSLLDADSGLVLDHDEAAMPTAKPPAVADELLTPRPPSTDPAAAGTRVADAAAPQPLDDAASERGARGVASGHAATELVPLTAVRREADPGTAAPEPGLQHAPARTPSPTVEAALALARQGRPAQARQELSRLLRAETSEATAAELRTHLTALSQQTLFAAQKSADDPLLEHYTVQDGDLLLRIGRKFSVPYEVIERINNVQASRIRAGQRLYVPRGPFHAVIDRSAFRMDVYLQDDYVRSFPVGLGADRGTPLGTWRVKERLLKPTYYPPASATDKRILGPSDPENPLGGFWIGLEGVDGETVGAMGYGIHGTIEPQSVGKAASLGCVRMLPDDIHFVYDILTPGASTVTVLP